MVMPYSSEAGKIVTSRGTEDVPFRWKVPSPTPATGLAFASLLRAVGTATRDDTLEVQLAAMLQHLPPRMSPTFVAGIEPRLAKEDPATDEYNPK